MEETEQLAFVLHTRAYREHQQLVTLLTECDGKVTAVVYAGKTNRSNKKALLQPLTPLKVILAGRTSLKKIKQIESVGKSIFLKGNYLYSAFYLNELLVRLLAEHVSCELLFHQYQKSFYALAEQQPLELILREFELTLLEELGLSFDFSPVFTQPDAHFYYLPEQGFIDVESLAERMSDGASVTQLSQPCYPGEHLKAIAEQCVDSTEVLYVFKLLMRQVLNQLLGNKPLHSRKLFKKNR